MVAQATLSPGALKGRRPGLRSKKIRGIAATRFINYKTSVGPRPIAIFQVGDRTTLVEKPETLHPTREEKTKHCEDERDHDREDDRVPDSNID